MDNIFMNSKNCKTFYPHGLLLKEVINMLLYQILVYTKQINYEKVIQKQ